VTATDDQLCIDGHLFMWLAGRSAASSMARHLTSRGSSLDPQKVLHSERLYFTYCKSVLGVECDFRASWTGS